MKTDHVLRVAPVADPHTCNTQQAKPIATEHATGAQRPSLKALASLALSRNTPRNRHATTEQPDLLRVARARGCNTQQTPTPSEEAEKVLADFAERHGIHWPDARSQMIDGDAVAGAANLAADTGDGVEVACVACWLRLLAARA